MAILFGGFLQQGPSKLALVQKITNSARLSSPPSGPGAEAGVLRGVPPTSRVPPSLCISSCHGWGHGAPFPLPSLSIF